MTTARLTLDTGKLNRLLTGRYGDVGRTMNAFAGLSTNNCKDVARERLNLRSGSPYLDSIKSTTESFPGGVRVRTESISYGGAPERATQPHVIRPRTAKVLRFPVGGRIVYAKQVSHPGTSAKNVLKDGVRRAGHQLGRIAAR